MSSEQRGLSSGAVIRRRLQIVVVLCFAGMISQFYRAANSVLAGPVMADVGLGPEAYGIMTAAFFVAFMLTQIPAGILLDRYGPRLTVSGLLILAVVGASLFAAGNGLTALTTARALLGVGCGAVIMGSFMVVSAWFPPKHFAMISAIVISTGHIGNLLATAPLAYAVTTIGWRATFGWLSALTLLMALLILIVVRDRPDPIPPQDRTQPSWRELLGGVVRVLGMHDIRRVFVLAFVAYASMITILGLWGGPYLATVHGLGPVEIGNALMFMPMCSLAGALCFGPLDQLLDSRKRAVLCGAIPMGTLLVALGAIPDPPIQLTVVLLAGIAFFSAASMLMIAHGRGLLPDHLAGRGMTTINLSVMGGSATFQVLTSGFLGFFADDRGDIATSGYRLMFIGMGTIVLLACWIYAPSKDVVPSRLVRRPAQH